VRQIYFPIEGCASSRLHVGDYVYVASCGRPNGIRNEPDVHPADNIIYRAPQGEGMTIVGGPACRYGWILWEVVTETNHLGWTPESKGDEFWLVPVDGPREPPPEIVDNPTLYSAYQEVESVMSDQALSDFQRRERIRIRQHEYGEEVVTTVLRWAPVYDPERGRFVSFDNYMRGVASEFGYSGTGAPIEQDPIGASMSIFFDPSVENITEVLGLGEWIP
jgi:hypothetical protein